MTDATVMLASKAIEDLVVWEFCDCGCPNQQQPKSPKDVDLLKLAAELRINNLKSITSTLKYS